LPWRQSGELDSLGFVEERTMTTGATWTRGQLWDKIVEQARKNPKYHQQLMADPRGLMEKQLGTSIPRNVNIKVLEESSDTYYIVVPAFAKEGAELTDSDLEKVAGGGTVKGNASCNSAQGAAIGVTVVDVSIV
jgi:Nitrile hydratase, alpha chain